MIMGLAVMMIPFSPSLPFFFALCAIRGWAMGSLDAGGNVLCLDIWQGQNDSGQTCIVSILRLHLELLLLH